MHATQASHPARLVCLSQARECPSCTAEHRGMPWWTRQVSFWTSPPCQPGAARCKPKSIWTMPSINPPVRSRPGQSGQFCVSATSRQKLPCCRHGTPRSPAPATRAAPPNRSRFQICLVVNTDLQQHVSPCPCPLLVPCLESGGFWLLSVPAPRHCHLPLPLCPFLLEEPAPCVFHMPSFDATVLQWPARPRCLQRYFPLLWLLCTMR